MQASSSANIANVDGVAPNSVPPDASAPAKALDVTQYLKDLSDKDSQEECNNRLWSTDYAGVEFEPHLQFDHLVTTFELDRVLKTIINIFENSITWFKIEA